MKLFAMALALSFSFAHAESKPKVINKADCEAAIHNLMEKVAKRQQAQDAYQAYPNEAQKNLRTGMDTRVRAEMWKVNLACDLSLAPRAGDPDFQQ